MKPLRIGMVVPSRGFAGGVEQHAFDLARGLRARGHTVRLLHGTAQGRAPDAFAHGFDHALSAHDTHAFRDLDVVHVHKFPHVLDLLPSGVPALVSVHDHDATCVRSHRYLPLTQKPCHRAPGLACVGHGCVVVRDRRPDATLPVRIRNPWSLREETRAIARRAHLLACSDYVARGLIDAGVPTDRVRVVHPIPPEHDDAPPPTPLPSTRSLLVCAQLVHGKGIDLAIRALEHLPRDVTLTVAGDGPSREALEALARTVAPGRVTFTGHLDASGVRAAYDACRVVLVPSRWPEPFGMVGLEGFRRARACVGAAHGGIPEWLSPEAGALFEPNNLDSLVARVSEVLEQPALGERAHRLSLEARWRHATLIDRVELALEDARASHA